jgi:hypothetical protein
MNEYELLNEKTGEFIGTYLSGRMLERGDIITFSGENYFVFNLMIPEDRKLRISVWQAKISLPGDIKDLRLLRWIQKNLIGMKIRLSNDKSSIEGVVNNYWPRISFVPPENRMTDERSDDLMYAEELPGRLEILFLGPDNPDIVDLLDYKMIEILGEQGQ